MEKQQYIEEQIDVDYILKSKNSALAFLAVSVLFIFFLLKVNGQYKFYIIFLTFAVMAMALLRLINVTNYTTNNQTIKKSVIGVSLTALANAFLWCAIGVLSILSFSHDNFQILVTFIILISFSAGSIVNLSHKKHVFIPLNYLILFPQIFYSVMSYVRTDDINMLWLLGYTLINLVYNLRQGKVVKKELVKRFSTEFELKKSLEEIALSKKHLEEESIKTFHASRLSSLGEMAGGIAHEINNPLTIIQGMTKSILVHNEVADNTIKTKLNKINSATERIARIVKGMKIISSKNDQVEHEYIKLSKVLEVSLDLFEERFKNENIDFQLENITDPIIRCNPLQISQILINLISNALDAIQKIEGKNYLAIKVTEDFLYHSVDIRIINSGPLLDPEVSSKIFEPFFTTKSLGHGTGLGLSISQTLAHSNEGSLTYENYLEQVCFKLHLETHNDI